MTTTQQTKTSESKCNKKVGLRRDLMLRAKETTRAIEASLLRKRRKSGISDGEFVNENEILDYLTPELHAMAVTNAKVLQNRVNELEKATASCNPEIRTNAIYLLNFAGSAKKAIQIAGHFLDDSDDGVRNNALRLVGVFAKYIEREDGPQYAKTACARLENENFYDRNKGIMMLLTLAQKNVIVQTDLSNQCLARVEELSRHSISDQIGSPAKQILGLSRLSEKTKSE